MNDEEGTLSWTDLSDFTNGLCKLLQDMVDVWDFKAAMADSPEAKRAFLACAEELQGTINGLQTVNEGV